MDSKSIKKYKIVFINQLLKYIKSFNITPIVLLDPIEYNKAYLNIEPTIQKLHDVQVINLVNYLHNDKSLWADYRHFNYKGRYQYSKKLINELALLNSYSKEY